MITGSIKGQVRYLSSFVDEIGTSKHRAKEEIREELGKADWHTMGKNLGVHSFNTMFAYRNVWEQCFRHAKEQYGIKSIEEINGEMVKDFLQSKIDESIARSTFDKYASALEKMEVALNRYAEYKREHDREYEREPDYEIGPDYEYDFEEYIEEMRDLAKEELEKTETTRAYEHPEEVISNLTEYEHYLVASLQYEGGARIHEASLIQEEQLKGYGIDEFTGEEVGYIEVQGKGGYEREIAVSAETYQKIEEYIKENEQLKIDKDEYRADLKQACEVLGEDYNGSHGLRWNFAQERFEELQREGGLSYEEALKEVSEEMGHHRADITEHYLRK